MVLQSLHRTLLRCFMSALVLLCFGKIADMRHPHTGHPSSFNKASKEHHWSLIEAPPKHKKHIIKAYWSGRRFNVCSSQSKCKWALTLSLMVHAHWLKKLLLLEISIFPVEATQCYPMYPCTWARLEAEQENKNLWLAFLRSFLVEKKTLNVPKCLYKNVLYLVCFSAKRIAVFKAQCA